MRSFGDFVFLREVGFFLVFLECGFADQGTMGAVGRVHRLVALGGGEFVGVSGLSYRDAGGDPRSGGGAQGVGVETLRGADAAGALASVAERNGDGVVGMSGLNPDGAGDFLTVQFKFDDVFGFDVQALGHRGTDLDGVVPRELVHRLGKFLQPAVVGELSVVDGGVAADVELDGVGIGF